MEIEGQGQRALALAGGSGAGLGHSEPFVGAPDPMGTCNFHPFGMALQAQGERWRAPVVGPHLHPCSLLQGLNRSSCLLPQCSSYPNPLPMLFSLPRTLSPLCLCLINTLMSSKLSPITAFSRKPALMPQPGPMQLLPAPTGSILSPSRGPDLQGQAALLSFIPRPNPEQTHGRSPMKVSV